MLKQVEKITPTTRKLDIDIPSSVIDKEITIAYDKLRASAKVPGFRVGKVPQSMLKKKFGKDIEAQIIEKIIPEFYSDAVKEAKILPVTFPNIDGKLEIAKNQPLSFTATVEIKPEITDLNYEGIALKEKTSTVEEDEVEKAIKALQENKTVFKVSKGPIKEGDMAVIDYHAFIDGNEINELKAKDYPFILGSQAMPKEFSNAITGREKADSFETKINFDSTHPNKIIAGKEVLFKISITEMKEKVLPPLDDEFAKGFSCSNIEELKKNINENIHKQKKNKINNEYKKDLIENLLGSHKFEVPSSMVSRELEFLIDEAKQNAARQGKIIKTDEELRKEYELAGHKNVRVILLLEAIGKKEKIEVSEDDIKRATNEMAAEHGLKPEEIKKLYIAKEGSLDGLKNRLYSDKVLDIILSKAVIEKNTD